MCCVVTVGLLSNQSHEDSSAFDFSGQTQALQIGECVCVCVSDVEGWTGKCICSFKKAKQKSGCAIINARK